MTNENNIRVIYKAPGAAAEVREVPNTLKAFQEAVGGFIETVTMGAAIMEAAVVICNEDGRWMGLAHNCKLCGVEFVGPILIAGVGDCEFASLDEDAAEYWMGVIKRGR